MHRYLILLFFLIKPAFCAPAFFGFALVDCGLNSTNYTTEIAAFSNVAHVCAFEPSDSMLSRFNVAHQNAVLPILAVQGILFNTVDDVSTPSGRRMTLRADYAARWRAYVTANAIWRPSRIAAFYIADEPVWNGVSLSDLTTACDLVKASFPTVPILIVEAFPVVSSLIVPTSVDIIGFNHYAVPNPQTDVTFLAELATLKSKRSTVNQKIMLVPDAQWYPFYGDAGFSQDAMAAIGTAYYNLAANDPDIIGLIAYLWVSAFDDPLQVGMRDMSAAAKAEYSRIGKLISGK